MRFIYKIVNIIDNKIYVGQTRNFESRKLGHHYQAKRGNFRPLYASIRKHGIENFIFEVIEECEDNIVNEREKFWIAELKSTVDKYGYNLTPGGNCCTSNKAVFSLKKALTGVRKSKSHCENIRKGKLGHPGLCGDKNPQRIRKLRGEKIAEQTRIKRSIFASSRKGIKAANVKLTEEKVRQIKVRLQHGVTFSKIKLEFDISFSQIHRIKSGKCWGHIACLNSICFMT